MKFHPLCEMFPIMGQSELKELAADIKANGLREPILTFEGKILDGRNRFMACKLARAKPEFRAFRGDAAALVKSLNLTRRHLNESQRSTIAADLANLKQGQKKGLNGGVSEKEAAKLTNVSIGSVKRARRVKLRGTGRLQKAVRTGKLRVSTAAKIAQLPAKEQDEILDKGPSHAKKVAASMSKAQAKTTKTEIINAVDGWWEKRKETFISEGGVPDDLINEVKDVIKGVTL